MVPCTPVILEREVSISATYVPENFLKSTSVLIKIHYEKMGYVRSASVTVKVQYPLCFSTHCTAKIVLHLCSRYEQFPLCKGNHHMLLPN